jgi:hypothetical protein
LKLHSYRRDLLLHLCGYRDEPKDVTDAVLDVISGLALGWFPMGPADCISFRVGE